MLLHDDVPIWVVLGHTENLHMVRTPSQFSRDSRIWTPLREGMVKPDHPLMPHIAWQPIASHAEGDEHLRLRGAVTGAMSTIDPRGIRRHINRYTQILANSFCQEGRAELVGQFCEHLPMAVLCEILGMPDEYNEQMVEAARDALKGTETAIVSHQYVMDALTRLTALRRAEPWTTSPATWSPTRPGSPTTRSGSTCGSSSSPPTRPPPTCSPTRCAWSSPTRASAPSSTAGR